MTQVTRTTLVARRAGSVLAGRTAADVEGLMRPIVPALRRVEVLPGAGHWVQQERPDQVNSLLLEFLKDVAAPKRS